MIITLDLPSVRQFWPAEDQGTVKTKGVLRSALDDLEHGTFSATMKCVLTPVGCLNIPDSHCAA